MDNKFENKGMRLRAFKYAFPKTIPILMGFLFLGMSYGFYMRVSGFSFFFPLIMSIVIFGGSLEFLAVSMLLSPFAPIQTFLVAIVIQARHLFYGLAMLEKYKGLGMKRLYLIYGMCDESFSINCSAELPSHVDKGWFYFFVTLLNHSYWILGATLGALIGGFISFNTEGIEFVMTAMFVVIFLEGWLKGGKRISSLIGVLSSAVCLVIFGADTFLVPSMVCIVALLSVFRKRIEGGAKK